MKRLVAAIGLIIAVGVVPAQAAPQATELFRFQDPRITEASGIAVGVRSPDVVYVQNDSGDSARFFAVDRRTGRTRATYTVAGATNIDWEDIAVAPDTLGTPSLWLADIGDNGASRAEIDIYRVDEPDVGSSPTVTARADVWRLRYPDGRHDAESLIVDGSGRAYVVTKLLLGKSVVYAVPPAPRAAVQTMTRVDALPDRFIATGASYGDGLLAIRSYTDAYVWDAPAGIVAALDTKPRRVPLPRQKQGEGIAISRDSLLIDSEGVGSPVYSVPFASPVPAVTTSFSARPATVARKHGLTAAGLLLILVGGSVAFFAVGFAVAGLFVLVRRRRRRDL